MMGEHGVKPCSPPDVCRRSVVLLLFGVAMATATILTNDPKCLSIGGLCVDEGSCPLGLRANESAICTGGVCCFGVPSDSSCREQGGRCGQEEECRNVRNFGQLDCDEGSNCCLLIF